MQLSNDYNAYDDEPDDDEPAFPWLLCAACGAILLFILVLVATVKS